MKAPLLAVLLLLCMICRAGDSFSLGDHPERNRRRMPYTSCFFDAGYAGFHMLGRNYHGGTFNMGIEGVGKRFLFGFHCGTDIVFNPNYNPNDSLPSPDALYRCLYLNMNFMFGVRLGERTKFELPIKFNLPFGGENIPTFYIPAFVNNYQLDMFTAGINCVFRLNTYQKAQNAYIGLGANYRFALPQASERPLGKKANFNGLSCFLFLRFDLNT